MRINLNRKGKNLRTSFEYLSNITQPKEIKSTQNNSGIGTQVIWSVWSLLINPVQSYKELLGHITKTSLILIPGFVEEILHKIVNCDLKDTPVGVLHSLFLQSIGSLTQFQSSPLHSESGTRDSNPSGGYMNHSASFPRGTAQHNLCRVMWHLKDSELMRGPTSFWQH